MQRRNVAKRRTPLQPAKLRPALSLPIPAAIYAADLPPDEHTGSTIVVPVRVDPYLLRCCEDGTAAFFLQTIDQPEAFMNRWGFSTEMPSMMRWQASVDGPLAQCRGSGVRPCHVVRGADCVPCPLPTLQAVIFEVRSPVDDEENKGSLSALLPPEYRGGKRPRWGGVRHGSPLTEVKQEGVDPVQTPPLEQIPLLPEGETHETCVKLECDV